MVLALVGLTFGWGETEDVVITDTQVYGASSEIGITHRFATLTIESGGSLTASRLYQGYYGEENLVTVNGGTFIAEVLTYVGYQNDVTFTQNGGLVQTRWLNIGRQGSASIYEMNGGLLEINYNAATGNASGYLAMPPQLMYYHDNYNDQGTLSFSGGEIRIYNEDWSAAGYDILTTYWFDDQSGGATVTWDGSVTTIVAITSGTITALNDPMQVLESDVDGSAVQFTVELSGDFPVTAGDTITLTIESPDPNTGGPNVDLTINDSSSAVELTFTDTTWNIPQTVTVKAIDDAIVDDSYAEVHLVSFSTRSALGDSNYGGTDGSDPDAVPFSGPLGVTVIDDETPSITISKTSVSVSEDGTVDSYTIALQTDPTDTVTVDIIADCQATATASLTFSAGDTGPKTVTVGAVDDSMVEASLHATTITHVVTTADPGYMDATISDVAVEITDNDARAWSFGDDAVLPITNHSFEDPILSDGGVQDSNSVNPIPGYEYWTAGELNIVNPDAAGWAAMYNAGHQQAPDGDQIVYLENIDPYSGTQAMYSVCEYLVEPGPVSYTFEVTVGVPNGGDGSANFTIYVDALNADGSLIARINDPGADTFDLSDGLVEGEWVTLTGCGEIPADSSLIGAGVAFGAAGQDVHMDNLKLTVGNHPCVGCTIALDNELLAMDFNGDCQVTLADFADFAANWMDCYLYPECVTGW